MLFRSCTFVLCGNERVSQPEGVFSLYLWGYHVEQEDVVIGQSFGVNKDGEHAIMHIRFLHNENDEAYFDIYGNGNHISKRYLSIDGIKYKVRYDGRAFKVNKAKELINVFCTIDSFSVQYGNETYKFKPGKLKKYEW